MAKQKPVVNHVPLVDDTMEDAPPVAVAVVPEPLEPGEVVRDERSQLVTIDGVVHHHTREARDGRWIYRPLKSA